MIRRLTILCWMALVPNAVWAESAAVQTTERFSKLCSAAIDEDSNLEAMANSLKMSGPTGPHFVMTFGKTTLRVLVSSDPNQQIVVTTTQYSDAREIECKSIVYNSNAACGTGAIGEVAEIGRRVSADAGTGRSIDGTVEAARHTDGPGLDDEHQSVHHSRHAAHRCAGSTTLSANNPSHSNRVETTWPSSSIRIPKSSARALPARTAPSIPSRRLPTERRWSVARRRAKAARRISAFRCSTPCRRPRKRPAPTRA